MPPKGSTSKASTSSSSKSKASTSAKPKVEPKTEAAAPQEILPTSRFPSFLLATENLKSYGQQYANIYFMRLAKLKSVVLENATRKWKDMADKPVYVPRVLDVQKGKLCYIVGTVYMDMPLKPNVLADLGKENWIQAPPPSSKYTSPSHEQDSALLEDDSGRVKLVGEALRSMGIPLVTGVIMACLGLETSAGEFEVVDCCFAGMAGHAGKDETNAMDIDEDPSKQSKGKWIALVSGLDFSSSSEDAAEDSDDNNDFRIQMLVEYLKGESGGDEDQASSRECSALIVLGNSLDVPRRTADDLKNSKRYNQQTTYDPSPLHHLSQTLKDLASSIPVHVLPGANDPASAILPQQPMPRAMFGFNPDPSAAKEGGGVVKGVFECETNPSWIEYGDAGLLATSGQNLDDVYRYIPDSEDRLGMARAMLQWRHIAPTTPDTLWCYPFFDIDPFLLEHSPSIYAIGNQPSFASELVSSSSEQSTSTTETRTRVVLVPRFSKTGEVVFVNTETLGVRTMRFGVAPKASWKA